ncbi:hypothetical protein ABZ467_39595 [Streptomyces sp. NPDC005727]|uniref:hypothetical protein n=1 Tax=Streptomyces sp. NPDC005727 TaxID=3157053 RepID=UPI00340F9E6B
MAASATLLDPSPHLPPAGGVGEIFPTDVQKRVTGGHHGLDLPLEAVGALLVQVQLASRGNKGLRRGDDVHAATQPHALQRADEFPRLGQLAHQYLVRRPPGIPPEVSELVGVAERTGRGVQQPPVRLRPILATGSIRFTTGLQPGGEANL